MSRNKGEIEFILEYDLDDHDVDMFIKKYLEENPLAFHIPSFVGACLDRFKFVPFILIPKTEKGK